MWDSFQIFLFAGILFRRLSVHHAALPTDWCCMLDESDAKSNPLCKDANCGATPDATTTRATTTPAWIVPVVLDPEAVEVTGNKTQVDGRLIASSDHFEGDILGYDLGHVMKVDRNNGQNFLLDEERHWQDRIIPYDISSSYRPKDKQAIRDALEEFMLKTPLKLRERKDTDKDYVYFAPGFGCNSYIGRQKGKQILGLQVPGCMSRGLIIHELMHATGFYHEQARTDRDDYIEINWNNIPKDLHNQFQSYTEKEVTAFNKPYDFASILHYGTYDFAIDSDEWTIRPRKNKTDSPGADQIGQRSGLSAIDMEKLKLAYPVESGSSCPKGKGWITNPNICYYFSFLTDTKRAFASARTFCRTMGAIVASERDEKVAEFLKSQMDSGLAGDARIYVASCNTITPNNVKEPQETDCTDQLYFICSKRLSVL